MTRTEHQRRTELTRWLEAASATTPTTSSAYHCTGCTFEGTAEQLAGHYRVVQHQPQSMAINAAVAAAEGGGR